MSTRPHRTLPLTSVTDMRYPLVFTLPLVLVAVLTGAEVLGVGVARAEPEPEPEPKLEDRPLPRPLRLEYVQGPRNCPEAETIEHLLYARVDRALIDPTAAARLTVTMSRQGIKYKATVEIHDAEGASVWLRPFVPLFNCEILALDIALVLSHHYRRPLPAPPEPAEPSPASSAPPLPSPLPSPPPPSLPPLSPSPPPSASPPRRPTGRIAASGGPGFGVAPADVAAVMNLEGGAQWKLTPGWIISSSMGVRFSPRASARRPVQLSRLQVEVGSTLLTSVFAPCLHRHLVFGWVFGCVGLELGGQEGDSAGIPRPASGVAFWAAINPRLGIEVPLASLPIAHSAQLALRMFGEMPVPLHRPEGFVGEGPWRGGRLTPVWVTPAVTGAVSVGLVTWFDP
jgi:hypothetical protein